MINMKNQKKHLIVPSVIMTLVLAGCSGGSSNESTEVQEEVTQDVQATSQTETEAQQEAEVTEEAVAVDYTPEVEKLDTKAGDSTQLYVEPEFQFDTFKTVTFDLQLMDYDGAPVANTMLFLSSIEEGVVALDDPNLANKSLIAVLKTDASGSVYKQVEVDQNVANVLLEINALGTENEVILAVPDSLLVQQQL